MTDLATRAWVTALVLAGLLPNTAQAQLTEAPPSLAPSASVTPATQTRLGLDEALRLALANNPQLTEAKWNAERDEASAEEAGAAVWPTVTAFAGYQRFLDPQRLAPISEPGASGTFSRDLVSGDLMAHMPLYAGGALTDRTEAARFRARGTREGIERMRQLLGFEVARRFYEIVGQQRLLEAFEASHRALQEERRVLEERIAVDKAAPVDTLRLDVRIAELEQTVSQARNGLSIRRRELAALVGMDPSKNEVSVVGDLADTRSSASAAPSTRADVLSAQAESRARELEVDVAGADRWPLVDARVTYGLRADFQGHLKDVGAAGVFVSVPLFDGGITSARVRKARALLEASRQRERSLTLQANLDVEAALLDIATAREGVRVSETAIEQARRAFDIEREKLAIGRGTTTEVLDAHAALIRTQAAHFGNLTSLSIARARLALARGESVR